MKRTRSHGRPNRINWTSIGIALILVCLSFGYTLEQEGVSKIYLIGETLIRTTPGTDIRLYDIGNPGSVQELGRIELEENSDVAAIGDIMYADRGHDLLVYDISDPTDPQIVDSVLKVFETLNVGNATWIDEGPLGPQDVGGASGCGGWGCGEDVVYEPAAVDATNESGQGGSLARFMIVGHYLYCIDQSNIRVFDISEPGRPRYRNTVGTAWGIETIFHDDGHLFVGGQAGMYIYSLDNPESPERLTEFTHRRSCDPVVVEHDRAYVTLRGGTRCEGYQNQLDIIDISDINNPVLLKSVDMDGPYGLAVRDRTVLVCDGASGLKTLNVEDLDNITTCSTLDGLTAIDVIWYDDLLIVSTEEGFFLYDASDPCHLTKYGRLF
jgi:hypothetical protein